VHFFLCHGLFFNSFFLFTGARGAFLARWNLLQGDGGYKTCYRESEDVFGWAFLLGAG
jgi:hypothetical protein